MKRTTAERFVAHVTQRGECWLWKGPRAGLTIDGVLVQPRQLAWLVANNTLPQRPLVPTCGCMKGDCIRPSHQREVAERVPAPRRPGRRLEGVEIAELRRRARSGETLTSLAKEFRISVSGACRIVNKQRRRHDAQAAA